MTVEAIVQAWKSEMAGQGIPASPVGNADFDGSLFVAPLDANPFVECSSDSVSVCTCYITCDTKHSLC